MANNGSSSGPSLQEYIDASNAVYLGDPVHSTDSYSTLLPEPGWKLLMQSPVSQLADGFYAAAYDDTNGNIIISYEGMQPDIPFLGTSYQTGTDSAAISILTNQWPTALTDAQNFATSVALEFAGINLFTSQI
jgi:hypothetical protein